MTAIMNIVLVALSMGSCVVNGQLLRTTTRTYGDTVHLTVDVDHWNLGYVDKASWTLPNGQTLQAGQSSSGFTASGSMYIGGRTSRYTLTVDAEAAVDGNIVFNVESAGQYMRPGWKATGTFKITKTKRKTPPKLTGKMSMTHHMSSYGQYQIEAVAEVTVHGGDPVPDKYEWRLPYGNTIIPGQKSGNYDAQYPTANSDGSKTYKLKITNNAQRSYIRFTASSSTAPYSTYATFGSGKK